MRIHWFSVGTIASALGLGLTVAPALAQPPAMAETARDAIKGDRHETLAQVDENLVPTASIVEIVSGVDQLSSLESALDSAGLLEPLMGEGPFTVIAPSNAAFDTLPDEVLDALFLTDNTDLLTEVLTYHVIPGEVLSSDLTTGTVETLGGEELDVVVEEDAVFVDGIPIVGFDVPATNGIIHVIQDGVLVPEDVMAELETRLAAEPEMEAEGMTETDMMETEGMTEADMMETEPVVEETAAPTAAPATPVRGLW